MIINNELMKSLVFKFAVLTHHHDTRSLSIPGPDSHPSLQGMPAERVAFQCEPIDSVAMERDGVLFTSNEVG